MSFTELETQALGSIADGLAGSDPRLAPMLNIFSRLAAGEEMPVREKIRTRRGRPAAHRLRRARRHPRRGIALPQARRLYPRLGWQQALLLPHTTVRADVEHLLAAPSLSPKVSVSGQVYDIATGRVTTVLDARHPQPAGNN